jgi:hypothetical protein
MDTAGRQSLGPACTLSGAEPFSLTSDGDELRSHQTQLPRTNVQANMPPLSSLEGSVVPWTEILRPALGHARRTTNDQHVERRVGRRLPLVLTPPPTPADVPFTHGRAALRPCPIYLGLATSTARIRNCTVPDGQTYHWGSRRRRNKRMVGRRCRRSCTLLSRGLGSLLLQRTERQRA